MWWCCFKDEVRRELGGMRGLWRAGEESVVTTSVYSADSAVPTPVPVWMKGWTGNGQGFPSGWWHSRHVCPLVAVIHSLFLEGVPWEAGGGMGKEVLSTGNKACSHLSLLGRQPTSLYLSARPGTAQGIGFGGGFQPIAVIYHRSEPIHLAPFASGPSHAWPRKTSLPNLSCCEG